MFQHGQQDSQGKLPEVHFWIRRTPDAAKARMVFSFMALNYSP